MQKIQKNIVSIDCIMDAFFKMSPTIRYIVTFAP
jgi:hypothetical protein